MKISWAWAKKWQWKQKCWNSFLGFDLQKYINPATFPQLNHFNQFSLEIYSKSGPDTGCFQLMLMMPEWPYICRLIWQALTALCHYCLMWVAVIMCLKVSRELLDKLREVEGRLQTHTPLQDERRLASYGQFQEHMNRLGDWVYISSQSLSDVTHTERQVRRSHQTSPGLTRCI